MPVLIFKWPGDCTISVCAIYVRLMVSLYWSLVKGKPKRVVCIQYVDMDHLRTPNDVFSACY